jgi:hypothetical protein
MEAPTFSDIWLTDGGKVVSPTHRAGKKSMKDKLEKMWKETVDGQFIGSIQAFEWR